MGSGSEGFRSAKGAVGDLDVGADVAGGGVGVTRILLVVQGGVVGRMAWYGVFE